MPSFFSIADSALNNGAIGCENVGRRRTPDVARLKTPDEKEWH
jgi:hypothetical protein